MTPAERDVRAVHSLFGLGMTWREIALAAIRMLAAREAEHTALRARYGRLLDEYRAMRQQTPRRAA